MKTSKEALGSLLEIEIVDTQAHQIDIDECFLTIEQFENTYSRFKRDNYLWELNHTGKNTSNPEIISLLKLCKAVSKATDGYFDITLLPLLENAGYGIEAEILPERLGSDAIEITENEIILHDGVMIDLGSLGKGYMLDIISDILKKKGHQNFLLNFGGDIKIVGEKKIGLEDPLRENTLIGELSVKNTAFAASSGNKRKFGDKHHILNPKTGNAQNDKIAVFTTHKLGTFADLYSTALFACPLEVALQVLEKTQGLEGLIIGSDGKMYSSQGFNKYLTLY